MTLTKIGASLSGGADVIHITQASHGFTVGQVLKVKSNDPGKYATAMANTAANAEVVGIVVQVISASIFVMALSGRITADGAVPDQQAGTVLFLSPSSAGALTVTEPTTTGEISKPVCVITTPDSEMIMVNYRGKDADAVHNWDANGSELILDVDGDTSLHADTDDRIDVKISGADDFRFTANTLSILSGSTLAIDSGATLANSGTTTGFTNNSTSFTVTQSGHGLSVGHVVKASGNSTFAKAQANTAANAEVVGVVTVVSGNDITITTSGEITVAAAVPNVAAGTVVFLHQSGSSDEGTLTATEPSTDDEISKPIAIVTYQNSKMVLLPFRGEILGTGASVLVAADGSITLAKMAANSIDSDQYVDGSIDLAHMSVNSIDSDQYVDGSIDLAHMSADSVDSAQYVDGSIDTAHIAGSQITNALMADNAIDSVEIVAGAIDLAHMSVNSIDSDQYVDGSIDLAHMSANSIDSAQYVDGSIDLAHMSVNSIDSDQYVDGSIDNSHLADDAVDSDEIAAGAIDLAHMSVNSVDSAQYVDGSIDLSHMSSNSIDSNQYVDGSIDLVHMSDNSVDSDQYVDASIDLAHMSVNSIDSDQYVDRSIDTAHIGLNQVTLAEMAGGTDGNLITYDTSGDPAYVATGSSGQVLTSNGADTVPTFQAASTGKDFEIYSMTISAAGHPFEVNLLGAGAVTLGAGHLIITSGQTGSGGSNDYAQLRFKTNNIPATLHFNLDSEFAVSFQSTQQEGNGSYPGSTVSYLGVGQVNAATEPTFIKDQYGIKLIGVNGSTVRYWSTSGDGTTEQATSIIDAAGHTRCVFTAGTSVKTYRNGILGATHTTNIPSGSVGGNHNMMNVLAADGGVSGNGTCTIRLQAHWHFKQEAANPNA